MLRDEIRSLPTMFVVGCLVWLSIVVAPAKSAENKTPQQVLDRYASIEQELVRLNLKNKPAATDEKRVYVVLNSPYIGTQYTVENNRQVQVRYVVFNLEFANTTDKPVVIHRKEVKLTADENEYPLGEVPSNLRNQGYSVHSNYQRIGENAMEAELTIPAGGVAETRMVFANLPMGSSVPRMTLAMPLADKPFTLDINQFARAQLQLSTRRTGPHDCLAILTIAGELNGINIGTLAEELDRLADDKVARAVVEWGEKAAAVDGNMMNWLVQSAARAGTNSASRDDYPQFPALPSAIRELHLANLPKANSSYASNRQARVHKETVTAVTAALRTAFATLPVPELLDAIRSDDPVLKAAAIGGGGGRLPPDRLPLLIALSRDEKDKTMQRSAVVALRHYGEPLAIERLIEIARTGSDELKPVAVEGLATSRFAQSQRALHDLLEQSDDATRKSVVTILAKHPAPVWSDIIFKFARDYDSDVGRASLQAIVQLGHPQLNDLLKRALRDGDSQTQTLTFGLLVSRADPESEELALSYALGRLRKSPPDSRTLELLRRTKDPRAVPLLLKHLVAGQNNRASIIQLLSSIGDESVADVIVRIYPDLDENTQDNALTALRTLRSPEFLRLAGEALAKSKNGSLLRNACEGLRLDGSAEAEKLLAKALEQNDNQNLWNYACNALQQLGTPAARAALKAAEKSENPSKRSQAKSALTNLRHRSPAYQFIYRGQHYAQNKQYKEAIEQYGMAIDMDAELIEAYTGRADVHMTQKDFKLARTDYRKALELDPENTNAAVGLGKAAIEAGEFAAGMDDLEKTAERFEKLEAGNRGTHFYNVAQVYAGAVAELEQRKTAAKPPADADKLLARARSGAFKALRTAVKYGYRGFDHMRTDTALKPIRGSEEFQKILALQKEVSAVQRQPRNDPFGAR